MFILSRTKQTLLVHVVYQRPSAQERLHAHAGIYPLDMAESLYRHCFWSSLCVYALTLGTRTFTRTRRNLSICYDWKFVLTLPCFSSRRLIELVCSCSHVLSKHCCVTWFYVNLSALSTLPRLKMCIDVFAKPAVWFNLCFHALTHWTNTAPSSSFTCSIQRPLVQELLLRLKVKQTLLPQLILH